MAFGWPIWIEDMRGGQHLQHSLQVFVEPGPCGFGGEGRHTQKTLSITPVLCNLQLWCELDDVGSKRNFEKQCVPRFRWFS